MVDVSKIKPGDEVVVKGVVSFVDRVSKVITLNHQFSFGGIPVCLIASHIPAKREFKVGDRVNVQSIAADHSSGIQWQGVVVGVNGDHLWVKDVISNTPRTVKASDCKHVADPA